jgi:Protein of unknown function (DUF4239)
MNWPALSRPAVRLTFLLVVSAAAYWLARQAHLDRFTAADAEGINALLALIGGIYAVVFAFVIFVIWGQFTAVEDATLRECGSLNELLRFSRYLNPDSSRAIRRSAGDYAQRVVDSEWRSLGQHSKDVGAEKAFATLIGVVVRTEPATPAEQSTLQRLVDIARKLSEHRDERIAKSLTRIPPTLLALVRTMVGALLLLLFVYPFHSTGVGIMSFCLLTVILFFSNLVMTDTDNPFDGIFNVSPRPFSELMLT